MDGCECGWREGGQWHHHKVQDQKSKRVGCRVLEGLVLEWLQAAGLHWERCTTWEVESAWVEWLVRETVTAQAPGGGEWSKQKKWSGHSGGGED